MAYVLYQNKKAQPGLLLTKFIASGSSDLWRGKGLTENRSLQNRARSHTIL